MRKYVQIIGQVMILWGIFSFGNLLSRLTGIPVPGNVIGMVLLFVLLVCNVIKLQYIEEGANFLLKHMLFFFIPVAVGLMNWGPLFYENGLALTLAIVLGAVIPLFMVGWVIQLLHKEGERSNP